MEKKAVQWAQFGILALVVLVFAVLLTKPLLKRETQVRDESDITPPKYIPKDTAVPAQDRIEVEMKQASVFGIDKPRLPFISGAHGYCQDQRQGMNIQQWPSFKSDRPLYGLAHFPGRPINGDHPSAAICFAIDESAGTKQGYDRLYVDTDGDQDLTDDTPLTPIDELPGVLAKQSAPSYERTAFKPFKLDFDFGDAGDQSIEIIPVLYVHKQGHRYVKFIATKLRKGTFNLAGKTFDVLLGYSHSIGSTLDQPNTTMQLIPHDNPENATHWVGSDQLNAMRPIAGNFYSFAATPLGDRLFVTPYKGEFGTFEIGPGGREISKTKMAGSLRSQNHSVPVGIVQDKGWPDAARTCELPVGDYLPGYLMADYGPLKVTISENYHADGKPHGGTNREKVYGIKIRKDKPFVLDFSNKPKVIFTRPARDTRVRVGRNIRIEAVLIDPKLDIMIRGLIDTSRKKTESRKNADGSTYAVEREFTLEPKVTITRSDGEVVAEGVMPFG